LPYKSRFTLAEVAEVEVVVHVGAEVVEAAAHVRAVDSRPRRLPLARLLAQPLPLRPPGQVLVALPLVLDPQVVPRPVRGPPAGLLPARSRRAALDQAEVLHQGKLLLLDSGPPERAQTSRAADQRPAR
jgi:hypothetical protein